MANKKSAKKAAKRSKFKHKVNLARKSDVKTSVKKVLLALERKDLEEAQNLLKVAESKITRARGKGVFKKNTAARKISRLAKKVANLKKEAA